MLVESYLRPTWFRFSEYACWLILCAVRHPRRLTMTLGLAQIRYHRWVSGGLNARWWNLENTKFNYRACNHLLSEEGVSAATEVTAIVQLYTGSPNPYYCELFVHAKTSITQFKNEVAARGGASYTP